MGRGWETVYASKAKATRSGESLTADEKRHMTEIIRMWVLVP